jgi:hypothetical protein
MHTRTTHLARIAGLLYLVVLITGAPPELLVRAQLVVDGDVAATAANIRDAATLVRLAALSDLVNVAAFLGVALILYGLLKTVHAGAARAMLVFNAVSVAIMSLNTVNHIAAWFTATNAGFATAFGADSSDALAMMFLQMHSVGFSIAEIFFGLWLFPLGWMLWRSHAVPCPLAGLVMVGTVGYLANVTATFLSPGLESSLTPILTTPPAIAETSLLIWLIAKGIDLAPRNASGDPDAGTTSSPELAAPSVS